MKFKFSSKLCILLQRKYTQSIAIITPQSMCTHHSPRHHSFSTTVHTCTPLSGHHSLSIITHAQEDLEHAGYDLEDGFGGREKEGTRFAQEKGTRFLEARAHDLQRRRTHDLQRLGHTICRGGGNTFLHLEEGTRLEEMV
jgi:hypothetical protein